MTKILAVGLVAAALCGCQPAGKEAATVKLVTLDPAHFHASLVQKLMYPQVSPVVHVYSPGGDELQEHLKRIEANLKGMRDGLSKATLRAPITGRVTSLKAEKGETAIPGMSNLPGATLMIISDMSEMQAEIKVNESEVVRTKVGQTAQVTVESLPGKVFQGSVLEVATGTEKTGTDANLYKVKVVLSGKREDLDNLRPGMSARAVILTHEVKGVLRVPLQAVLEREGSLEEAQKQGLLAPASRNIVMVFRNGKAEERTVQVGIANTQFFELKEGLAEGDKVLTGPIRKLKELKTKASVSLRARSDSELAKTKDTKK